MYLPSYQWGVFNETNMKDLVRQKLGDQLQTDFKKLDDLLDHLEFSLRKIKGCLTSLQNFNNFILSNKPHLLEKPLFESLSMENFVSVAEDITAFYSKEIEVKHVIRKDLLNNDDRDTLLIYLSAWSVEAYIDTTRLQFLRMVIDKEFKNETE